MEHEKDLAQYQSAVINNPKIIEQERNMVVNEGFEDALERLKNKS